jgi:hypothetical protein
MCRACLADERSVRLIGSSACVEASLDPFGQGNRRTRVQITAVRAVGAGHKRFENKKHRGVLLLGSAIRSCRPGAHLQLNVHTPMGNEKQIPECRAQWEQYIRL